MIVGVTVFVGVVVLVGVCVGDTVMSGVREGIGQQLILIKVLMV